MREEAAGALQQPLILVVDDVATMRAVGADALQQSGFRVAEAADGDEAIRRFDELGPDLVLLDVEMPGRDGFETCRELRARPRGRHLPIVMMTSRDDLQAIHRAYEAGATDFVAKPVNWLILTHRIRYMLRLSELLSSYLDSEMRLAEAQRVARLGSLTLDLASGRLAGSEELYRIFDLPASGVLTGDLLAARVQPEDAQSLRDALARAAEDESRPIELELRVPLPNGDFRFVQLKAEPSGRGDARLVGAVQDVTERKRSEEAIRFLAYHDSLTRLGNRRLFKEHLKRSLARARRSGDLVSVLFVDLDHFKRINDTLGHEAGDLLLQRVSERMTKCVRDGDCVSRAGDEDASVSRFGGDEFIILLDEARDEDAVARVAQRVLDVLSAPLLVRDRQITLSASIGIASAPRDADDAETLLRQADAAMYQAKRVGRNNFQFFRAGLELAGERRLALEGELRRALQSGGIEVHYQPKVDLRSGATTGFEALARWHHPGLGSIPPLEFVSIAEEAGLIDALGEIVIRSACMQAQRWQDAGLEAFRVSVNLSPQQIRSGRIVETVERILEETGASPALLDLEITESTLMENESSAVETLHRIKGIGITVSLDDFGTGYSSLSYLKRFPVDTVKIDRSFVRDIPEDADDSAITAAIISMAQALGLRIVAEGVETEQQRAFLSERGCDEMQGYLISPPVPADEIGELLDKDGDESR